MKLGKLKQAEKSLEKLLSSDLPVQEAYKLSRCFVKISEELIAAEKIRSDLITKKYGVKDEKTNNWTVPQDKIVEFAEEYNKLLDVDVDIPIVKINIDNLNGTKLSPIDLHNLDFIFEETK